MVEVMAASTETVCIGEGVKGKNKKGTMWNLKGRSIDGISPS